MRLIAGRYRLLELLGRGGFGAVWRAVDELLRREVAVKELQLSEGGGAELLAQAVAEARSAAALDHPAIVTVHDIVVDQDRPWIIMKLIRGRNLHQVVTASGPLTEAETARHGLNLLDALTSAHVRGVVHRDVKPENVMIDERGEALLTDFSIARMAGVDSNTTTGMIMGTPGFVPPERARTGHTGPAGDLFALGATLYYAVEGRAPYRLDSDDPLANLLASARQEHEPPRRAPRLAEVLGGLLVKEPERRLSAQRARTMLLEVAQPARAARPPATGPRQPAERTAVDGPPVPGAGQPLRGPARPCRATTRQRPTPPGVRG